MREVSGHGSSKVSKQARRRLAAAIDRLESRVVLYSGPVTAAGLPILESLPGSGNAIYLDFDGEGSYGPFDLDGNPSTFNAQEQDSIYNRWYELDEYYAPFNINVTTVKPASMHPGNPSGTRTAWALISNDYNGDGLGSYNSFPDDKPRQWMPEHASAGAMAHETGHNLNLYHMEDFHDDGGYPHGVANPYAKRLDMLHGQIMGASDGMINKWTRWHLLYNPGVQQDDIATITGKLDDAGGDGFRPDDVTAVYTSSAPALTVGTEVRRIIERMNDVDVFKFVPSSTGRYTFTAGRSGLSGVDLKVAVKTNSTTILAAEDGNPLPITMMNSDHHLTVQLTGGTTYYFEVQSHGNYGDLGAYIVRVDPMSSGTNPNGTPATWQGIDLGINRDWGYASYNSGTGVYSVTGGGENVGGIADGLHYVYQPLMGDATITVKVASMSDTGEPWSMGGLMIRDALYEDAKSFSVFATLDKGNGVISKSATGGDANYSYQPNPSAAFTPVWLRIVRTGNSFQAQTSSNGTSWSNFGSARTITMGSASQPVYIGIFSSAINNWTPVTVEFSNLSTSSTTNVNPQPVTNTLSAPTLTLGTATNNSIAMSWTNISGESGYAVEQSSDGINYKRVDDNSIPANQTTFTAMNLEPAERYFFRVRAMSNSPSGSVSSNISTPKSAVTRAGKAQELRALAIATDQMALEWREASNETGYRIERSTSSSGPWTSLGTVPKDTQIFKDTGPLTSATTYYYRIVTLDSSGDSATSATASNAALLTPPTLTTTGKTSSSVSLSWTSVTGATEYEIWRMHDGDEWDLIDTVNTTTYTDTGVASYDQVKYVIYARSSDNQAVSDSNYVLEAVPPASGQALPSGWSSTDIGTTVGVGTAGKSGGTFTVIGSGTGLGNTSDQIHFASQSSSSTNSFIEAQVDTQELGTAGAIAGVMIRETNNANSKYLAMYVQNETVYVQWRTSTGGSAGYLEISAAPNTPVLLCVQRFSSTIWRAYYAPAGTTNWVLCASTSGGQIPSLSMSNPLRIGMFTSSADVDHLEQATFNTVRTNISGSVINSLIGGGGGLTPSKAKMFSNTTIASAVLTPVEQEDGSELII